LVCLSEPPPPGKADEYGVTAAFFIVEPNQDQLIRLAALVDGSSSNGRLHVEIARTYPARSRAGKHSKAAAAGAGVRARRSLLSGTDGDFPARPHVAGRQLAADDLAGLDARRAGVDPLLVAAGAGHDVHSLDVGVPPAAGAAVGVRHRLTEAGAFPADIAHSGHSSSSSKFRGSGTQDRSRRAGRAQADPGQARIPTVVCNHQNTQQSTDGGDRRCHPRWLGSMGRFAPAGGAC
jgi:hypothetical protein